MAYELGQDLGVFLFSLGELLLIQCLVWLGGPGGHRGSSNVSHVESTGETEPKRRRAGAERCCTGMGYRLLIIDDQTWGRDRC